MVWKLIVSKLNENDKDLHDMEDMGDLFDFVGDDDISIKKRWIFSSPK